MIHWNDRNALLNFSSAGMPDPPIPIEYFEITTIL